MKVCFICNEYPDGPHGGIGTVTKSLAEGLTLAGHQIIVLGVYDKSYPSPEFEFKNNIQVYRIKVDSKNRFSVFWGYWKLVNKIKRSIRNGEIDIIECPDSYGMLSVFKSFSRPFVLRAHGNNTYFSSILHTPLRFNTKLYEKRLYKKADYYCAVSRFTANRMREIYKLKQNIEVIYNGIDTEIIESTKENSLSPGILNNICNLIVFSGTLTAKKGIYELIQAVLIVLKKNLDLTLIINGKDTQSIKTGLSVKEELLALIPEEYKKKFIFNGHVTREEIFGLYSHCKAAIFPSYAEAFAMAPMEAMILGVPTIFSGTCSGKEIIKDKINGLLVNPYEASDIANAIIWILMNPELAQKIAGQGKETVKNFFSQKEMVNNTNKFYEKAIIDYFRKRRSQIDKLSER